MNIAATVRDLLAQGFCRAECVAYLAVKEPNLNRKYLRVRVAKIAGKIARDRKKTVKMTEPASTG